MLFGEEPRAFWEVSRSRGPSTPPAAPSSILFILQRGDLVRESKLPSSFRPACTPAPNPFLCKPLFSWEKQQPGHVRPCERSRPTGLTSEAAGSRKAAALPSPRLTWAGLSGRTRSSFLWCFRTASFRSCSSAQAVMALSTWCQGPGQGPGAAAGRARAKGRGWQTEEKEVKRMISQE